MHNLTWIGQVRKRENGTGARGTSRGTVYSPTEFLFWNVVPAGRSSTRETLGGFVPSATKYAARREGFVARTCNASVLPSQRVKRRHFACWMLSSLSLSLSLSLCLSRARSLVLLQDINSSRTPPRPYRRLNECNRSPDRKEEG